jgi:hypothetical protein
VERKETTREVLKRKTCVSTVTEVAIGPMNARKEAKEEEVTFQKEDALAAERKVIDKLTALRVEEESEMTLTIELLEEEDTLAKRMTTEEREDTKDLTHLHLIETEEERREEETDLTLETEIEEERDLLQADLLLLEEALPAEKREHLIWINLKDIKA